MNPREELMTKIREAMVDTEEEYMSKLDGLFLPRRLKREELVMTVDRYQGIFDIAWDAYMDAAYDAIAAGKAYAAWDSLEDALKALDAYDEENT